MVGKASSSRSLTPKAERTRARILDAAEAQLARRGLEGTRVEAVAKQAGIRRATLFYHFSDKTDLYENVLSRLVGPLLDRIRKTLATGLDDLLIERAISEYFDHLAEHPNLARIVLREVADAEPGRPPPVLGRAHELVREIDALLRPLPGRGVDAMRLLLMVSGASLFFVSASDWLEGETGRGTDEALDRNKAEVARLVRRELGLDLPQASEEST